MIYYALGNYPARPAFRGTNRTIRMEERKGWYNEAQNYGRKHRGGACGVRVHRCRGHLSHHPVVGHGGTGGQMVGRRAKESVRANGSRRGDAERGGRGRDGTRFSIGRRADDDLHGVAGAAADDP